jgi:hypothetical protein
MIALIIFALRPISRKQMSFLFDRIRLFTPCVRSIQLILHIVLFSFPSLHPDPAGKPKSWRSGTNPMNCLKFCGIYSAFWLKYLDGEK